MVYNNENIKFFCKDFVNINLKAIEDVKKIKKYDLVLKIAVLHLED